LFPNSFETALVAKLARVPRRFGYAKESRSFLLTDAVPLPAWKNERHEVFYYLNLVAAIEKEYCGTEPVFENAPPNYVPRLTITAPEFASSCPPPLTPGMR
jgi:heptosyltransferase-2